MQHTHLESDVVFVEEIYCSFFCNIISNDNHSCVHTATLGPRGFQIVEQTLRALDSPSHHKVKRSVST